MRFFVYIKTVPTTAYLKLLIHLIFWLSYTDFIRIYVLSEVYIDLVRVNQYEGFSFRIPEALWLNRKIISNRISLQDEPFYSTDRVF